MSYFVHLSVGLPLLRFFPCIKVEVTYSTGAQRYDRVGGYVRLLNLRIKKQCKAPKLLFVLLLAAIVQLVNEGLRMSIIGVFVKRERLVGVLDKRVSGHSQEEDVFPKRNVEAWRINGRSAKRLCL